LATGRTQWRFGAHGSGFYRVGRRDVQIPIEAVPAQAGLELLPLVPRPPRRAPLLTRLLYLDQNYLSGIAKRKPGFVELEPVLRAAVARGDVAVVESAVHERESRPRPDLGLLALLRDLSGGRRLPDEPDAAAREARRRMAAAIEREFPERRGRVSDAGDLDALAIALTRCDLVTCDAFMADVVRRTRLDARHGCELFSGRRADVRALVSALRAAP
jgi:hypothetical protein